jgi:hypothetical protein
MDPPLCGAAVIGHNEVRETDDQLTARRPRLIKGFQAFLADYQTCLIIRLMAHPGLCNATD